MLEKKVYNTIDQVEISTVRKKKKQKEGKVGTAKKNHERE